MALPGLWVPFFIYFSINFFWSSLTSGSKLKGSRNLSDSIYFIFTTMRFILEILAALAVIFSPLDILAFLGGLLTLPMASLVERLVGLIKE